MRPSLVDPEMYLGGVTAVSATVATINLPEASTTPGARASAKGAVGDFVFVDCEEVKLLGKIIEVKIPEGERLFVEPTLGMPEIPNPIGKIQLLASINQAQTKVERGIVAHPRVGDSVFLARPMILSELLSSGLVDPGSLSLSLGTLSGCNDTDLHLRPEKLFGRHCGVFGATGGGKSWTVATLLHKIKEAKGKAILFDPTGEFAGITAIDNHYAFDVGEAPATLIHFPYRFMSEEDLFAMFRPSGQSQGPRLREAIRSLKLLKALAAPYPTGLNVYQDRMIVKHSQSRKPFLDAISLHAEKVYSQDCNFDIEQLGDQLNAECIYSTDTRNPGKWGGPDQATASYCENLIARIRTIIHSRELNCLFGASGFSLVDVLNRFFTNETDSIIRISFKNVRFEHYTREILMNIIGRYLLGKAREGTFRQKPIITILDEAHQFLGRQIGEDQNTVRLEAFGLIAKEGRKYGLTCTMATQRPRDIPSDVLSQLGTLIVHRLTNEEDRRSVESVCGDMDKNAAMFIPTLAPGEAIIVGPDLPAPVPVLMHPPTSTPDSRGPDFGKYWRSRP